MDSDWLNSKRNSSKSYLADWNMNRSKGRAEAWTTGGTAPRKPPVHADLWTVQMALSPWYHHLPPWQWLQLHPSVPSLPAKDASFPALGSIFKHLTGQGKVTYPLNSSQRPGFGATGGGGPLEPSDQTWARSSLPGQATSYSSCVPGCLGQCLTHSLCSVCIYWNKLRDIHPLNNKYNKYNNNKK